MTCLNLIDMDSSEANTAHGCPGGPGLVGCSFVEKDQTSSVTFDFKQKVIKQPSSLKFLLSINCCGYSITK